MYVIESGEISVLETGPELQPTEITMLPAGDIAGELSLFGQSRRSATLQAHAETTPLIKEALQNIADTTLESVHEYQLEARLDELICSLVD